MNSQLSLPRATPMSAGKSRRGRSLRLLTALSLVGALAVALWTTAAPNAIGGDTGYVITAGVSMLPDYEANGLVITREQESYRVGDVVAYMNKDLDAVILHRIVALDGDRYVLQGDNNHFLDRFRPTRAEVIGKKWSYWPGAGSYLRLMREPVAFGAIVGLMALVSMRIPESSRRRRRHHAS